MTHFLMPYKASVSFVRESYLFSQITVSDPNPKMPTGLVSSKNPFTMGRKIARQLSLCKFSNHAIAPPICIFWRDVMIQMKTHYFNDNPDSKIQGANMGPICGQRDPGGPHVGPMNFAIWECNCLVVISAFESHFA